MMGSITALRSHFAGEGNESRNISVADSLHYNHERSMAFETFLTQSQKILIIYDTENSPMDDAARVRFLFKRVHIEALKAQQTAGINVTSLLLYPPYLNTFHVIEIFLALVLMIQMIMIAPNKVARQYTTPMTVLILVTFLIGMAFLNLIRLLFIESAWVLSSIRRANAINNLQQMTPIE